MNKLTRNILIGAAAGLAAAWLKSKSEKPLQEVGEKVFPPRADQLYLKGADVTRLPENMPPAILANKIYREATGTSLDRKSKIQAMKVIHYAVGAGIGATYAVIVNPVKIFQIGKGYFAGAFIWAVTHGSLLPRYDLQDKVRKMPKSWWVWEFGSHLIYGVALEQSRRVLTSIFTVKKKKQS